MSIICSSCGSSIDSGSAFCDQCGAKLVQGGQITQTPTQTISTETASADTLFYQAPSGSQTIPPVRANKKMIFAVSAGVVLLAALGAFAWSSSQKGPDQPAIPSGSKTASQNASSSAPKKDRPQVTVSNAQKPSPAVQGTNPAAVSGSASPEVKPPTAAPPAAKKTSTASKAKTTINQVINQKQTVNRMYMEYLLSITNNAPNQTQKRAAFNSSVSKLGHMLYNYYVADKRGTKAQARDEMRLFLVKLEGNGSPASNQEIAWGVGTVR